MSIPDYRETFAIKHDSASGATAPKYEQILKWWLRNEHGISLPMSAKPWAGICVQHGVDLSLGLADYDKDAGQQQPLEIAQATKLMLEKYDGYEPRSWDGGKDAEEFEAFREHLPEMLANGKAAVEKAFTFANRMEGEYQIWHKEPKIDVPIMIFQDYSGGNTQADLKCSLPVRNTVKKDGSRTWRVPKPKTEPTKQQVMQQAVYWKATGQDPSLLFVTAAGYHVADQFNTPALQEENLELAYQEVVMSWQITQNLLKAANGSWRTLAGLVQPDFEEIRARHGDEILTLAKNLWS